MTSEQAIEELKRGTIQDVGTANKKLREALGLGIEALKEKLAREKRGTP